MLCRHGRDPDAASPDGPMNRPWVEPQAPIPFGGRHQSHGRRQTVQRRKCGTPADRAVGILRANPPGDSIRSFRRFLLQRLDVCSRSVIRRLWSRCRPSSALWICALSRGTRLGHPRARPMGSTRRKPASHRRRPHWEGSSGFRHAGGDLICAGRLAGRRAQARTPR